MPNLWKEAWVVPLYKKGTRKDKSNYRPVSILQVGSKIMEEVVQEQLAKHMERDTQGATWFPEIKIHRAVHN